MHTNQISWGTGKREEVKSEYTANIITELLCPICINFSFFQRRKLKPTQIKVTWLVGQNKNYNLQFRPCFHLHSKMSNLFLEFMEKDHSIFMAIFIVFLYINFRINSLFFSLILHVAWFYVNRYAPYKQQTLFAKNFRCKF